MVLMQPGTTSQTAGGRMQAATRASATLPFLLRPGMTIVTDFATATIRCLNTVARLPRVPTDGNPL